MSRDLEHSSSTDASVSMPQHQTPVSDERGARECGAFSRATARVCTWSRFASRRPRRCLTASRPACRGTSLHECSGAPRGPVLRRGGARVAARARRPASYGHGMGDRRDGRGTRAAGHGPGRDRGPDRHASAVSNGRLSFNSGVWAHRGGRLLSRNHKREVQVVMSESGGAAESCEPCVFGCSRASGWR